MNDTECALYWATESWLEMDVPTETGLPPEMCRQIWIEIDRVRTLFRASIPVVARGALKTTTAGNPSILRSSGHSRPY
jgi:hypothetical protein